MESILKIENLCVSYPVKRSLLDILIGRGKKSIQAVSDVGLSLGKGQILALVGESGSGKTTTGKALVRLHETEQVSGSITYRGKEIGSLTGRELLSFRRKVQMIFQDPYQSLNPRHTLYKILTEPLRVHGLCSGETEYRSRALDALKTTGLTPPEQFIYRYPHELSGGQRQRVAIASALVLEPEILVADEPVSMLDVSIRGDILKIMMDLRKTLGIAYLFITHDLSLAWALSDTIAIMYLGRIMEYGDPDSIVKKPLHPYTKALINVMPRMEPRRGKARSLLTGEIPSLTSIPAGCVFSGRCPVRKDLCSKNPPPLAEKEKGRFAACYLI